MRRRTGWSLCIAIVLGFAGAWWFALAPWPWCSPIDGPSETSGEVARQTRLVIAISRPNVSIERPEGGCASWYLTIDGPVGDVLFTDGIQSPTNVTVAGFTHESDLSGLKRGDEVVLSLSDAGAETWTALGTRQGSDGILWLPASYIDDFPSTVSGWVALVDGS